MPSSTELEGQERIKHEKMMARGTGFSVTIKGVQGKEESGEVRIQSFNPSERLFRALKLLAIFFGLTLVSLFIPIAHFFLAPGFFLAGLVISYLAYGTESVVLGGEGLCPNCGAFLPIARGKEKWPLSDLCTHCRTQVTIERTLS